MRKALFLLFIFLIFGCEKKVEPVEEQVIKPAEKAEKEEAPEKVEETVDISNELKALRIVPDENNAEEKQGCIAYRDADGDGFGDESDLIEYDCGTDPKIGYSQKKGDCDDRNRYVNPDAVETCNGGDDNCDGKIDPEDCDGCNRYYKDMDGDGVGVGEFKCLCVSKGIYASLETGDCDDSNKDVHHNAREICNDIDDNCNGQVDEGENLKGCRPFYYDKDGDGYGYQSQSRCLCRPDGLFRAEVLGDCNDDNISINPGAVEIFDRRDNNCNGAIDENVGIKPKPKHRKHPGKNHGRYDHHHKKDRKEHTAHDKYEKKPEKRHVKEQHVRPPQKQNNVLVDKRKKKKDHPKKHYVSQPERKPYTKKDEEEKKKKPKKKSVVGF